MYLYLDLKCITNFIFIGEDNILINLLSINLILPLLGILITSFIATITTILKKNNHNSFIIQKTVALWIAGLTFISSLILLLLLNKTQSYFQANFLFSFWNFNALFGVDFISMSLIVLTNLFIYLCILSLRPSDLYGKYNLYEILLLLFFIQWGLLCAFSILDLLGFFIFFEATLVPIFLIILRGGSRERKARASFLIALYTLLGSIFMLFNIIYILNKFGSTNNIYLLTLNFSAEDQKI